MTRTARSVGTRSAVARQFAAPWVTRTCAASAVFVGVIACGDGGSNSVWDGEPTGNGQSDPTVAPDTTSGDATDVNNDSSPGPDDPAVTPNPDQSSNPPTVAPGVSPNGTAPVAPDVAPNPSEVAEDCDIPGPRMVRRLSPIQYYRTLQALFQDNNVPQEDVLSNPAVLGFHIDADASLVRDLGGELLMNYAETVATWAVESKAAQLSSCQEHSSQCHRQFIASFGMKAHREPLSEETIGAYEHLFAAEETFAAGMTAVIAAMLQSPYTLYRRELGVQQGDEYVLTPYEVASQLSYLLTDGPPDQALYDAASNGNLTTPEDAVREAERLLQSNEARSTMSHFVDGWLEIDKLHSKAKNESVVPLPAELRQSMVQETRELFLNLFYSGGTLSDLYTADYTYIDQRLAAHYGLPGGGQSFERVELSGSERALGMLGHGAFLTTHALPDNSSPVQRAKIVVERLLCEKLPPVPQGLNTALDPNAEFTTNRSRYEQHQDNDLCRGCHTAMDPIGFAFEHYDGFGRYRDQENGYEIDATGLLANLAVGQIPLDGADSLSNALASSPEAQACLVRYWSYFAHGRDTWENAACNRGQAFSAAQAEGFTLKSVLLGLIRAPNFSRRVADK